MIKVEFKNVTAVKDELLKYAVIVSRYQEKWIYCKHKQRNTWEIPGGRRELGEPILDTAKRELFEESGALDYELTPVCAYCVISDIKSYGLLCYADIHSFGQLPASEIERFSKRIDDYKQTYVFIFRTEVSLLIVIQIR